MPKTLCFWKGGLERFISLFIFPIKPIREKYPSRPKTHKLDNLVLIAEDKNTIQRNSDIINVYMLLHADFEDVEFYATSQYVLFTKE